MAIASSIFVINSTDIALGLKGLGLRFWSPRSYDCLNTLKPSTLNLKTPTTGQQLQRLYRLIIIIPFWGILVGNNVGNY